MAPVRSNKKHKSAVENQGSQGHCIFIVLTSMLQTIVNTIFNLSIVFSCQPLVDNDVFPENDNVADFISDPDLGLQAAEHYAYWREARNPNDFDRAKYTSSKYPRWYLYKVESRVGDAIKEKLKDHFLGNGLKFPIGADLYTGTLGDPAEAKERLSRGTIYKHKIEKWYTLPSDHSVLIVGINVTGTPRQHYARVRCSWGPGYGDGGYTNISLDVIKKIWFAVQEEGKQGNEGWCSCSQEVSPAPSNQQPN